MTTESSGPPPRVIVFDMDETLGHFVQLGGFWDALQRAHGRPLAQEHFIDTMKLYPEYVRPGMEQFLGQLTRARDQGAVSAIVMYTNNQGPLEWAQSIAAYFDQHAGSQVFDMIIPAYMVRGRRVSPCRTSHAKSPSDFLRCTGLPEDTRICFVDDQYHGPMGGGGSYYIRAPEYVATLMPHDLAGRYIRKHGAHLDRGFQKRLGEALLSSGAADGSPPSGMDLRDTTGWLRAHVSRFLALSQPGVSRKPRKARNSRRRRGGMTRRRRHALMWF